MWLSSASLRRQSFGSHSSSIANSGLRRGADGARVAGAFFPGHIESKICLRKRSRRLLLPTPTAKQMVREVRRVALRATPDDRRWWRVGLGDDRHLPLSANVNIRQKTNPIPNSSKAFEFGHRAWVA